jgi:hypothetical protein
MKYNRKIMHVLPDMFFYVYLFLVLILPQDCSATLIFFMPLRSYEMNTELRTIYTFYFTVQI